MPRNLTTIIDDTQCIGDSLVIINNNYENLDTAVGQLSSKSQAPITVNNPTTTIDLDLDSSLNLTGNVRENSITGGLLAPGNIIQVVHYNITGEEAPGSADTEYQITSFNANITPSNSTNRILIQASLGIAAATNPVGIYIKKNTTSFDGPSKASHTSSLRVIPTSVIPVTTNLQYLDESAGSSNSVVTYQFWIKRPVATALGINVSTAAPRFRTTSSITLYEIKV
jgi:hypothetical protein